MRFSNAQPDSNARLVDGCQYITGGIHGTQRIKTEGNLKAAFAGESQANRRYLYLAKADVEGQNDVAAVFRSTAEGETGHAHGHLEYLEAAAIPQPVCLSAHPAQILQTAIAGETHSIPTCIPAWPKPRAKKALMK